MGRTRSGRGWARTHIRWCWTAPGAGARRTANGWCSPPAGLALEHHVRSPLLGRDLDAAAHLRLRKPVLLQLLEQHFLGLLVTLLRERVSRVDGERVVDVAHLAGRNGVEAQVIHLADDRPRAFVDLDDQDDATLVVALLLHVLHLGLVEALLVVPAL